MPSNLINNIIVGSLSSLPALIVSVIALFNSRKDRSQDKMEIAVKEKLDSIEKKIDLKASHSECVKTTRNIEDKFSVVHHRIDDIQKNTTETIGKMSTQIQFLYEAAINNKK